VYVLNRCCDRAVRMETARLLLVMLALSVQVRAAAPTATQPARRVRQLLNDPDFLRGFVVQDPKPGKHVSRGAMQVDRKRGKPVWRLAQWSSRDTLAGVKPRRLDGGAVRFADAVKAVTFGSADGDDRGVFFAMNGSREYGGGFRQKGEPWAHLLAEQRIAAKPAIGELAGLRFRIQYRLRHAKVHEPPDEKVAPQAAQFLAYLSVQDLDRRSVGYGDYLWFGVQMYDNRYRIPRPHAALDKGSGKFIFNPPGSVYTDKSVHDGGWVTIDRDVLPLIREGLDAARKQGFLTRSGDVNRLRVSGFNMGWELPGTIDVEMQFKDLRIDAVHKPMRLD